MTATPSSPGNSQQFGPSTVQTQLVYVFGLTTAFSKFRETNDKLSALRRSLAANTPPMAMPIYSSSVSPSDAARERARQGRLAQLFTEARQRGEQLARAAGVNLGGVLGVSEIVGLSAGVPYGPYGVYGPGTLRTTFSLSVRYAVR